MKNLFRTAKKIIIGIICGVISFIWLLYAVVFMSPIWMGNPDSKEYEEEMLCAPIGIFMAIIWLLCFAVFIIGIRIRRNSDEQKENLPIEQE